uniref:Uncharacterized protein n=1 Tax=Plectus sambesii TaxID=2011161 RepID=A0A914WJR8_9BILA
MSTAATTVLFCCLLSCAIAQDTFNTDCDATERVTFVKLPHDGQGLLGNAEIVVPSQTLKDCVDMCRFNADAAGKKYPCAGVDYVRDTRTCMISGPIEDGALFVLKNDVTDTNSAPPLVLPFDEDHLADLFAQSDSADQQFARLMKAAGDFGGADHIDSVKAAAANSSTPSLPTDTTGFYKKTCLKAIPASYISRDAIYAFEQTPNRVLLESTEENIHANSSEHCIAYCLQAKELYDFVCLSVMYYYETKECLLNSEDQHTSGRQLSRDTEGLRVDYFENHVVSSECGPGAVPQYVIVNGTGAADVTAEHTLSKTSRDACEHFCSTNRAQSKPFVCKAFVYNRSTQQCLLLADATTVAAQSSGKAGKEEIYMEKICLGAASTCIQSPVFEKIAGFALIGFSRVILENVPNAEICLTECIRALTKFDFACLSVMFYADTGECVLNYDTLRTPGGKQPSNQCPIDKESTYIKYPQQTISNKFDSDAFQAVAVEDCFKGCETAQNFTCNSVKYIATDGLCVLSSQNSKTVALTVGSDDENHFDRRCIRGSRLSCGAIGTSFEAYAGRQLDRNASFEVSGVSDDECLSLCLQDPSQSCRSVNYIDSSSTCQLMAQTALEGELAINFTTTYFINKCFEKPPRQNAAVIHQQLLGETPYSEIPATDIELLTDCQYGAMKVLLNSPTAFKGFLFAKNRFESCRADVKETTAELDLNFPVYNQAVQNSYGNLPDQQGDCGVVETRPKVYSVIVIVQMNDLGIPGLVTDSDRFFNITCDYSNAEQNKVIAQGVPVNVKNSPKTMVDLHPDGRIDIPSPLSLSLRRDDYNVVRTATLGERLNIVFEYTQAYNRNVMGLFVRQCNATRGYGGLLPQPDSLIMIDDGCPMPAVQDTIITGPVARSQNGFTVPFSAFKFDGGNSVRISCMVDMCEGECNPTTCSIGSQSLSSFGRKKRHANEDDTTSAGTNASSQLAIVSNTSSTSSSVFSSSLPAGASTRAPTSILELTTTPSSHTTSTTDPVPTISTPTAHRNITKTELRSLIFTVVDHAVNEREERNFQEAKLHKEAFNDQKKDRLGYSSEEVISSFMASKERQVCLPKATFVGVVLLLTSICMCEAIIIVVYCVRRWMALRRGSTQKLS